MNKKVMIGISLVVLIAIIGIGGYFLLKRNVQTNAPAETKIPEEEIIIGSDETKNNKDGNNH